ncbi:unnamed protein product [Caenorhabditis auriculariae]|uniref:Uncharacterized protein n=1 Tax=Caenorhabditis auriculariae TaxID=2777116 RepID=A0A8S1HBY1_9PELO|nr:unnamed protein product [Caenorhabditis auriculariae]
MVLRSFASFFCAAPAFLQVAKKRSVRVAVTTPDSIGAQGTVASSQSEWEAGGPPRRSISTVCGPDHRQVNAFYQHFFPEKLASFGGFGSNGLVSERTAAPHQPFFPEPSFDPTRFSPPNVTPPPSNNNYESCRESPRTVRFDLRCDRHWEKSSREAPPRKSSLAPNFFSSHHHDSLENSFVDLQMTSGHTNSAINGHTPSWNPIMRSEGPPPSRKSSCNESRRSPYQNATTLPQNIAEGLPPNKMEDQKLFTSIQHRSFAPKRSHPSIPTRKASLMALKSQLRTPREALNPQAPGLPYTPPPILAPVRNGSGLFWRIAKALAQPEGFGDSSLPVSHEGEMSPMDDVVRNVEIVDQSEKGHPARKNGFFYMASQISQPNFVDELEALRKESWASTSSTRSAEEVLRKHSVDTDAYLRKASCMSDCYYDLPTSCPKSSDVTPHINLGKEFQARVRKWNDREVHESELEAIPDRDELVFSSEVLRDIDQAQVTAFEALACSQACPRPGRNKELALHLLMENKGNIESAVEDLLRSDTLDWEQYPIIYASSYADTTVWTPEEVNAFQDAIYMSEKDFQRVSQELPGKSVRECVEFYYNWKKACPDDYRKLRNLRRKRQLLEINLQKMEIPESAKKICADEPMESDAESDVTGQSFSAMEVDYRENPFTPPIACSPREDNSVPGHSPIVKDFTGVQRNYQPLGPRTAGSTSLAPSNPSGKKGAQPSADGFFHCRLCDKCFEKVKSLNAHMKSHAMKARAEAEAKAHDAQVAAASAATVSAPQIVASSPVPQMPFSNGHLGIAIPSSMGHLTPQQLTPQQLTPQQLNSHLGSSLSSHISNQLSSQLPLQLTPQQQLVAQNLRNSLAIRQMNQLSVVAPTGDDAFSPNPQLQSMLQQQSPLAPVPQSQHPLLHTSLPTIH